MAIKDSTAYVYVIGVTTNPVKVGLAGDPGARLRELQVGNSEELKLHHASRTPYEIADELERQAHRELEPHHRRGEWFNVDAEYAIEVIERLRKPLLIGFQVKADRSGDLLLALRARWPLHNHARSVVARYWKAKPEYQAHANGYIQKKVGDLGYAMFSLVVAQGKELNGDMRDMRSGAALAKAINALVEFHERYEEETGRKRAAKAGDWRASITTVI